MPVYSGKMGRFWDISMQASETCKQTQTLYMFLKSKAICDIYFWGKFCETGACLFHKQSSSFSTCKQYYFYGGEQK